MTENQVTTSPLTAIAPLPLIGPNDQFPVVRPEIGLVGLIAVFTHIRLVKHMQIH